MERSGRGVALFANGPPDLLAIEGSVFAASGARFELDGYPVERAIGGEPTPKLFST